MASTRDAARVERYYRQQFNLVLGTGVTYFANLLVFLALSQAGGLALVHVAVYAVWATVQFACILSVVWMRASVVQSSTAFTMLQMMLSALPSAYMVVFIDSPAGRGIAAMMGLLPQVFGALGLNRRRLIQVSLYYIALYAVALLLVWRFRSAWFDWRMDRVGLLAFCLASLQTSVLGGYVFSLRDNLRRRSHDLKTALEQISGLANTDALTGLYNRRMATEAFESQLVRSVRTGEPFCVAMIDVDHFKYINDTWGHDVGDEALRRVARTMQAVCRASDILGRWGGEEFVMLMPSTTLEGAAVHAERLRAAMEAIPCYDLAVGMAITVSVGVAEWHKDEALHLLISRADRALYRAKDAGRNCVVCEGQT